MLIGIDIVDIERMKVVVNRTPRFLSRVFTDNELQYCYGRHNPYPSLAARFAAKEAFCKLHPALSRGVRYHEVEVIAGELGRPQLILHGQALDKCTANHIKDISISISHTWQQAVAAIVGREENARRE